MKTYVLTAIALVVAFAAVRPAQAVPNRCCRDNICHEDRPIWDCPELGDVDCCHPGDVFKGVGACSPPPFNCNFGQQPAPEADSDPLAESSDQIDAEVISTEEVTDAWELEVSSSTGWGLAVISGALVLLGVGLGLTRRARR